MDVDEELDGLGGGELVDVGDEDFVLGCVAAAGTWTVSAVVSQGN